MSLSRSQQMSRVCSHDTRPEVSLSRALWARGVRYRKHLAKLAGRPDLVVASAGLAVFLDGCQWHGCPEHYVRPRTRNDFWGAKLDQNVRRDARQTLALEGDGWRVVRIWEHEVSRDVEAARDRVLDVLAGNSHIAGDDWRVYLVEVIDATRDLERRHMLELREPQRVRLVERVRSTSKR